MYLQLLTLVVIALVGLFLYFQIISPLVDGTPLFPFFSEREKVEVEIDKEVESIDVNLEKYKLNKLKQKRSKSEQKVEEQT